MVKSCLNCIIRNGLLANSLTSCLLTHFCVEKFTIKNKTFKYTIYLEDFVDIWI